MEVFKRMSKRGRPLKLTLELQEEIVRILTAGNYVETACAFVGLSKNTFYDWMKRGVREKERLENNPKARMKKSEEPFVEFSDAVHKALAQAEIRDVAIIGKAASSDWKASAWRLTHRHPSRWGKTEIKADIEHSGEITNTHKEEKNINITQQITADEESRELLKQLWRRSVAIQSDLNEE